MEKQLNTHNVTLRTCGLPQQFVSDTLPQVALCGRSNVGKSSLVNTLLGRKKLARVSGEPGKTITVNYYNVGRFTRIWIRAAQCFRSKTVARVDRSVFSK